MARIRIGDLPADHTVGREEMRNIRGGVVLLSPEDVTLNYVKIETAYVTYNPSGGADWAVSK